ncbi:MAG: M48 family metalloprotease [Acidobacteriota bacterium]
MLFRKPITRSAAALLVAVSCLVLSCSVNPATGKREFMIVSEAQEIAMGQEAHPQILAQFGVYPDEELQEYISRLGKELAAKSERPNLPWTFTLLDDPLVNAFALPGGFIYITRGIMAHLNSEAELVGILGHEIAHVTARHGASQMSKQTLAQIGLVAGVVAAPELAQNYGGLAQQLTGLLFLKYGRDDERQADAFGFRYAKNSGWDPRALEGVFDTLGRVSAASGGGGMPAWASTHPAPANRSELIRQQVAAEGLGEGQLRVDRDGYLQRLDGMVYGADPRQGFFREGMFYHPQMAFQMRFPQGWPTQNSRQAVVGINPDRNAMVQLSLRREETVQAAAQAFFQQQGVERGQRWDGMRHDPSLAYAFQARDAQGVPQLGGIVSFLEQGDVILQLIGYGRTDTLRGAAPALRQTLASFAQLRDRRLLSVEPMRLEVQRARSGTSLQAVARNASIDAADLELINAMDGGGSFPSGSLFKTVRGFNPARN